jgi:hypothetical protein
MKDEPEFARSLQVFLDQTSDAVRDINKCFKDTPMPSFYEVQRRLRVENYFSTLGGLHLLLQEYVVRCALLRTHLRRMKYTVSLLPVNGDTLEILTSIGEIDEVLEKALLSREHSDLMSLEIKLKQEYQAVLDVRDVLAAVAVSLDSLNDSVESYMKK